jgi:hypothetical protein
MRGLFLLLHPLLFATIVQGHLEKSDAIADNLISGQVSQSILSKCLQMTLRSVTVDAYEVCLSYSDKFAGTRTRDKVTQFIQFF